MFNYIFYFIYLFFSLTVTLRCRRTVAIETGCQNVPLCYTILKVAFEPEFIGPYCLFPFLYFFFQIPEALILITLFRWHTRQKSSDEPAVNHQDLWEFWRKPGTNTSNCTINQVPVFQNKKQDWGNRMQVYLFNASATVLDKSCEAYLALSGVSLY